MDKLQAFFEREDVKTANFDNEQTAAARAKALRDAIDRTVSFPADLSDVGKNV